MIQVCGERVLSENRMKRKRLSDKKKKKKTRSKRRKRSREKRAKMLERTPIRLNYGKRNAKEDEKDKSKKANI